MLYKSDCTFIMHCLNQTVLVHVTLLHLFSYEMSDLHLFS